MPRGRPKGSKNKPKTTQPIQTIPVAPVASVKTKTAVNPSVSPSKPLKKSKGSNTAKVKKPEKKAVEAKEKDVSVVDAVDAVDAVVEVEAEEVNVEPVVKKGKPPKSDDKKYPHCERCGRVVYCEPWRCDTNMVTGRADYHRDSPRYVKLCSPCSMELSELVDKWMLNDGNGVKNKFDK